MRSTNVIRLGIVAGAVLLFRPLASAQDDEAFDRTPEDCVPTRAIEKTHVLDDQTILFHMRDNRVFRNYLPYRCATLEREDRFMYQTRNSRLCNNDTITVLQSIGTRLDRGMTCALGSFQPLTPEEVELLYLEEGNGRGRDAIDARPAEVPNAGRGEPTDADGIEPGATEAAPRTDEPL